MGILKLLVYLILVLCGGYAALYLAIHGFPEASGLAFLGVVFFAGLFPMAVDGFDD